MPPYLLWLHDEVPPYLLWRYHEVTMKWSSRPRFSVLEILGDPKVLELGSAPWLRCSAAQKARPLGLGPLHAESSCV